MSWKRRAEEDVEAQPPAKRWSVLQPISWAWSGLTKLFVPPRARPPPDTLHPEHHRLAPLHQQPHFPYDLHHHHSPQPTSFQSPRPSPPKLPHADRSTPRPASAVSQRLSPIATIQPLRRVKGSNSQLRAMSAPKANHTEAQIWTDDSHTSQSVSVTRPTIHAFDEKLSSPDSLRSQRTEPTTEDVSPRQPSPPPRRVPLPAAVVGTPRKDVRSPFFLEASPSSSHDAPPATVEAEDYDSDSVMITESPLKLDDLSTSPVAGKSSSPAISRTSIDEIEDLWSDIQRKHQEYQRQYMTKMDAAEERERTLLAEQKVALELSASIRKSRTVATKLIPLTQDQQAQVTAAFSFSGSDEDVIVNDSEGKIERFGFRTLSGDNWLGDEVINSYLRLLVRRSESNEALPKVWSHNTFFLTTYDERGFGSVQRWTRKVQGTIFSKDLLIVPVHLGNHWTCGCVNFKEKRILYFDSLGHPNSRFFASIRKYLDEESRGKRQVPFDFSGWTDVLGTSPKQTNCVDCGVFACQAARCLASGSPLNYSQNDMKYFRTRMAWELISQSLLDG
eukprot:m.431161 g.431161  ORF g.431161 m.431161 type:complete len:560 (-) comp56734_c0_seq12:57-1736(-)